MAMSSTTTPPIEISRSSASPRNNESNLTSGLRQARIDSPSMADTAMRPAPARQDSLGFNLGTSHTSARPISVNRRRESNTGPGSLMNGMSWGGMSIGSLMQDDIMMTGTSPYNIGSPSFHSSSYLPKMEANFWNNLRCCDIGFNDLHELLQHFEDNHSQAPGNFPNRMSLQSGSLSNRLPRRKSSQLGMSSQAGMGQAQPHPAQASNQVHGFQPGLASTSMAQHRSQQGSSSMFNQDMDTIGEMEMDEDEQSPVASAGPGQFSQNMSAFSSPDARPSAINTGLANMIQEQNKYQSSNPTTPLTARANPGQLNNPMVSSVNTPTMGNTPQMTSNRTSSDSDQQPGTPQGLSQALQNQFNTTNHFDMDPQALQTLNSDFGDLGFNSNDNGMLDLCINDPAKALFSENGGIDTNQFPNFNFLNGPPGSNEAARRAQAQQLAMGRGVLPGEEDRPFKCPVIGCEKAYKNANGLRYHEKHGHSNQKLKRNDDGTFSIVDPLTQIPYPGTVGMEKEKPYRCEVCGKRYKNLNGLKYHRNHSPPCNPDFNINNVSLPGMNSAAPGDGVFS